MGKPVAMVLCAGLLTLGSVPPAAWGQADNNLSLNAQLLVAARQGDAAAAQLLEYMVSPPAQAVLQRYGFGQP